MSKLPPHVISMMVYCHRCKAPQHVLQPDKKLAYCIEPDDADNMNLKVVVACPSCQTKLRIFLCQANQITNE